MIAGAIKLSNTVIWNGTCGVTETKGIAGAHDPFAHATLSDEDVSIDFARHTSPADRVAVVVTAPLTTNETWTAFAPGELKVFEAGVLAQSTELKPHPL